MTMQDSITIDIGNDSPLLQAVTFFSHHPRVWVKRATNELFEWRLSLQTSQYSSHSRDASHRDFERWRLQRQCEHIVDAFIRIGLLKVNGQEYLFSIWSVGQNLKHQWFMPRDMHQQLKVLRGQKW